MRKTYNVALEEGVDYDTFWDEIETDGSGSTYVPDRAVDVIKERPTSLRQCWYELTDEEAEKLRNDPRVYCVEIPIEFRDDIAVGPASVQRGLFWKYYPYQGGPTDTSATNCSTAGPATFSNVTINSQ